MLENACIERERRKGTAKIVNQKCRPTRNASCLNSVSDCTGAQKT